MPGSVWRDGWLWTICIGRIFCYANFMVYAACLAQLRQDWGMSATQAGTISAGFTCGYAVSLLVSSWLAERYGARRVFTASVWCNAVSALAFGLFARDYLSALLLYTLAASTQGGMYTPAVMLLSERYGPQRRGAAVGALIASTSAGYAFSLGLAGLMQALGDYRLAFIASGILPVLGILVQVPALRRVANTVHPRPEGVGLGAALIGNASARRLILGYICHSWELLGMWAWAPAFLAASLALANPGQGGAVELGAYLTALMHGIGVLASVTTGHLSDRFGRRIVLVTFAAASTAFSLSVGWLVALPALILVPLVLAYGFAGVGDSPVLSTALTEAVPPAYLGSALALRSLLGFGAGAVSPVVFGALLDFSNPPGETPRVWGPAFVSLGVVGGLAVAFAWGLRLKRGEAR